MREQSVPYRASVETLVAIPCFVTMYPPKRRARVRGPRVLRGGRPEPTPSYHPMHPCDHPPATRRRDESCLVSGAHLRSRVGGRVRFDDREVVGVVAIDGGRAVRQRLWQRRS